MRISDRSFTISAAAICGFYALLRIWRLTDPCLWFDEIFGIHAAEHAFGSMLWFVAQDLIHPPLFYVLLKGWIGIGGESLMWVRMFSVVFSIAAIAPFLMLCKELKMDLTARIVALAFFAANGSMIKYAQEVRMYAPFLFLSLVSTWLFARFFYRGKNIWLLTLVNILLVYTHYFGWFVALGQIAAILVFQRVKIRHVLIMFGILLVSYVPWIWALARAASLGGAGVEQNIGWIERPGIRALFDMMFDLVEPFYFQASSIDPTTLLYISVPLMLIIAAAKVHYFLGREQRYDRGTIGLLAVLFAAPILLAFLLSMILPVSIWGTRHLITVFPLASIFIGIFVGGIYLKPIRVAAIAVVGVIFTAAFAVKVATPIPDAIWCAWERHAAALPGGRPQKVYVFEDLVAYHFWFATRERTDVEIIKINGMEGMSEDKAYFLPRGFDRVSVGEPGAIAGDEFLVAFRDMQWNEKHQPLNYLLSRGYKIGPPLEIDAGGLKAFLVEVTR